MLRAHQGAVRSFLRRLTGETMRADELAQETFLKAYRVGDLNHVEAPRAWLYRIAYRRYLDDRRKSQRRDGLSENRIPADASHRPAHAARLDIARAMDALPTDRRACALLCLALGHSHAEAAGITGLPLGTVKSHITRARAALQDALSDYSPSAKETAR